MILCFQWKSICTANKRGRHYQQNLTNSETETNGPKAQIFKFKAKRTIHPKLTGVMRLKFLEIITSTWKERAIVIYFLLHDFLGRMNLKLTSKAFAILDDLNVKDVIASIKNVELFGLSILCK